MEQRKPDGKKVYNQLAAAEIKAEDNYNQIDGLMNNSKKPTLKELLDAAKQKQEINEKNKKHKVQEHKFNISEHSNSRDDISGARRSRDVVRRTR